MADLTVTLTEEVTVDGHQYGGTKTLTIANIDEIFKRVVTCSASQTTTIATFANDAYETVGAIDIEDSKYIRITNLDSSNPIELAIVTVNTNYQIKLNAGHSHILGSANDLMLAEADTNPSFGTMDDVKSIRVNPSGHAIRMEILVASA